MIPWIKRLLWDQTAFERYGRAAILIVGGGIATGQMAVPEGYEWIGVVAMGLAGLIGAGDRNPAAP